MAGKNLFTFYPAIKITFQENKKKDLNLWIAFFKMVCGSLKFFCTVRNFTVRYGRLKRITDFDRFTVHQRFWKLLDRDFHTRRAVKIVPFRGGLLKIY